MFSIVDFVVNIRESYKECTDRLEANYKREFENYPQRQLEKIWNAIEENHQQSKAPEMGHIFKYMNIAGVGRVKDSGLFWNKCNKCGCEYSLRARLCPDCNRASEEPVYTQVTLIKGEKYKSNHITCRETCPICPVFKNNRMARGVKCQYWNTEDRYLGNCDGCPCKLCCNEKPSRDLSHEVGTLMEYVKTKINKV